ncbi:hypothetical protein M422DRAFT_275167 [Sphaerobolus stellatus SS14]|uniref:Uncharacterized protein n=1 Tax=Sphaerobolus stellatus (strain SS14) TaxID=990650 RepID=A0A0C9UFX3_SPHS4|nr:hypothetical protein M422DRAFT_275167 [Sphaerobolus stellatus SS14]
MADDFRCLDATPLGSEAERHFWSYERKFDCIPHLTRPHNLTRLGGFNWDMTSIAGEKEAF